MILITGAAGFIGSYLTGYYNRRGRADLILVDDFSRPDKAANYQNKQYQYLIKREALFDHLKREKPPVSAVLHIGARTDTTETDVALFDRLNLAYSQKLWIYCTERQIPLIYASSAATYGGGEHGYSDRHEIVPLLKPLNPYGQSKQDFDLWVLAQKERPPFWAGLKFFNVYGPNEYHKGRMASVVFHTVNQIRQSGKMKLFRSHRPDFKDGEQARDFIYVRDVAAMVDFLLKNRPASGLYNIGTGRARTFRDLVTATFRAMGREPVIEFMDTPADIRDNYQYFTQAEMTKLLRTGYDRPVTGLEEGIADYVQNYLLTRTIF